MPCRVEVTLTPSEFLELRRRDLRHTTCVVFDVLRATSSFVTALANGARQVIPAEDIPEALALKRRMPEVLLAGEREGRRIGARLAGVEFDFGNSPREFQSARIDGKIIVSTTTNGTRALRACAHAGSVLAASWLNLSATKDFIRRAPPERLVMVCAGTGEDVALEDTLAAGHLCHLLEPTESDFEFADSARSAQKLFEQARENLPLMVRAAKNAQRLLAREDLREDVDFCLQMDRFPMVVKLDHEGILRKCL